ncbi:MAG: cysK [Dehalococcoidia bacterium]|nr:cysK [Dehalococcoidia bacterium]
MELRNISPKPGVRIFAKLEGQNPTGSVKDRIAKYMVERAEASGELTKDKIILEPTSGNTGISLAMIGLVKGYRVEVVMPENVSPERQQLLELYGAVVHLTDGSKGTNGAIEVASRMAEENPQYFMPYQYGNPANPQAHYETTAEEIIQDLPDVDVFIAGLGTGGTLTGVGRRLKEHNPAVRIVAVVPHPGDLVQGLRSLEDGFIPPVLDETVLDSRIVVSSEDSFVATKDLMQKEGIFAGISSGGVMYCAVRIASRMESGNVVALLADGGWKYVSTGLWTKESPADQPDIDSKVWW